MPATTTASGLIIEDLVVGQGAAAAAGQNVSVHYTGWLSSAARTARSSIPAEDRGLPFEFSLGAGQVIKGWDEGVQGMKVGGKRKLTIPPEPGLRRARRGRRHPAQRHADLRSRAARRRVMADALPRSRPSSRSARSLSGRTVSGRARDARWQIVAGDRERSSSSASPSAASWACEQPAAEALPRQPHGAEGPAEEGRPLQAAFFTTSRTFIPARVAISTSASRLNWWSRPLSTIEARLRETERLRCGSLRLAAIAEEIVDPHHPIGPQAEDARPPPCWIPMSRKTFPLPRVILILSLIAFCAPLSAP